MHPAAIKIDARNHPEQATTGSETLPQTLYDNWQLVKSIPTMTGDFMWTGYDYLGESGIGTIQYKDKKTKQNADPGLIISGGAGIIDICGKKRPEVGWSKIIWGLQKTPTIGVDPYTAQTISSLFLCGVSQMRWKAGHGKAAKGKKASVTIYSDADKIELLVNGKSAGKKKPKKEDPMQMHRVLFVVSEENYTVRYLRSNAQPNANSTTPLTASTGTGQFS